MIKNLYGGRHIVVNGNYAAQPSVYNYSNGPGVGNVRYSPTSQCLEVFDGSSWQVWSTAQPTIELSAEATQAIDWANEQRSKLIRAAELAKDSPTIADALEQVKIAQEKLNVVLTLTA